MGRPRRSRTCRTLLLFPLLLLLLLAALSLFPSPSLSPLGTRKAMASPQCCANPPTLNPASGQGSVVDNLGGLPAYVAGSADEGVAVILASDVYARRREGEKSLHGGWQKEDRESV